MPKEIPLRIPEPITGVDGWIILAIDPSLSRSGYAVMKVLRGENGTVAAWLAAGSTKPDAVTNGLHPDRTIWIRTKVQSLYIKSVLEREVFKLQAEGIDTQKMGLIFALEAPPPRNDYLASIHRAVHTALFDGTFVATNFQQTRVLYINAATLRSLMHLTQKGSRNKGENIAKAYEFINKQEYPELDTDSCDAVLVAMTARYAASIAMGFSNEVPQNFLNSFCNATQEMKSEGTSRQRLVTKGIFHRNEYWYMYARQGYNVCVKDATIPKKTLSRVEFFI